MSTDFACDIPSARNVYSQDEQVGKRDGGERKRGERREEIIMAELQGASSFSAYCDADVASSEVMREFWREVVVRDRECILL